MANMERLERQRQTLEQDPDFRNLQSWSPPMAPALPPPALLPKGLPSRFYGKYLENRLSASSLEKNIRKYS